MVLDAPANVVHPISRSSSIALLNSLPKSRTCNNFQAQFLHLLLTNYSTPEKELEACLNAEYGPGNRFYDTFVSLIRQGLENDEGWVATEEIDGATLSSKQSQLPDSPTHYFSITTVYMESVEEFSGQ